MEYSTFTFTRPSLTEITFIENKAFKPNGDDVKIKTSIGQAHNLDMEDNSIHFEMTVEVGEKKDSIPFYIKIKMGTIFKYKNLDDAHINDFIKLNAPSLLIGYIRPIIAFITSQSQYPTYHLPFINFDDDKEN